MAKGRTNVTGKRLESLSLGLNSMVRKPVALLKATLWKSLWERTGLRIGNQGHATLTPLSYLLSVLYNHHSRCHDTLQLSPTSPPTSSVDRS